MKNPRILAIMAVLAVMCSLFAFAGTASAATLSRSHSHTVSTSMTSIPTGISHPRNSIHPLASGGGCSGYGTWGNLSSDYVEIDSCISANGSVFPQIFPDGYIIFGSANNSLWSSCSVTIEASDITNRQNISYFDSSTFSCLSEARSAASGWHISANGWGVSFGHTYDTLIAVHAIYNGAHLDTSWQVSPPQSI